MFARYDYSEFPEVRVFFTGSINTEEDFTLFTEQWIKLYDDKKDFFFIFDMENIGFIHWIGIVIIIVGIFILNQANNKIKI